MPKENIVEKWGTFEAAFSGPSKGNPFLDVAFDAVFSQHGRNIRVPGFYDGDGTYRVRFMPDNDGEWTFRTRSKTAALDGKTGSLTVVAPSKGPEPRDRLVPTLAVALRFCPNRVGVPVTVDR